MHIKPILIGVGILCGALLWPGHPRAEQPIPVVASFSLLADLVRNIAGERVRITTLVPAGSDPHVYQPKPADAQSMTEARLLVVNGLGFDNWLERLARASRFQGKTVVASAGIQPRSTGHDHHDGHHHHAQDDVDPHAWQDVRHAMHYVGTIARALAEIDPAQSEYYRQAAARYQEQLTRLDGEIRARFAALPTARRTVITSHDAFGYFGAAYGITLLSPAGISTEAEPSAAGIARLIRQIRTHNIRGLLVENISDPRLIQQIARETGARIGGTLYADSLSAPDGPAPTYIDMMRHNATTLWQAMQEPDTHQQ